MIVPTKIRIGPGEHLGLAILENVFKMSVDAPPQMDAVGEILECGDDDLMAVQIAGIQVDASPPILGERPFQTGRLELSLHQFRGIRNRCFI